MDDHSQKEMLPGGRARRVPTKQVVSVRVAKMSNRVAQPELPEGVMPLNAGFFALERLRMREPVKPKAMRRKVLRGK